MFVYERHDIYRFSVCGIEFEVGIEYIIKTFNSYRLLTVQSRSTAISFKSSGNIIYAFILKKNQCLTYDISYINFNGISISSGN